MHISEVSFGRTVKCFNPLNQEEWIKCNVKVSLNETDNVSNGEQLATQFVDEKIQAEMIKRNLVYVADEDLQDEIMDYFRAAQTDDLDAAINEFNGEFSKEDVQLLRLHFISEFAF